MPNIYNTPSTHHDDGDGVDGRSVANNTHWPELLPERDKLSLNLSE